MAGTTDTLTAAPRAGMYVGPRSIETGEPLFGRDRETTALTSLLIGERVVLLYSPSGAGKSSVIQAGLVPAVREEGFLIPPLGPDPARDPARPSAVVIRLNTPPRVAGANRYLLSTLLALEDHRPKADRRPAAALAGLSLADYLAAEFPTNRASPDDPIRPLVLLFDQFEELLTLDPTDVADKLAFLKHVGEVLKEPSGDGPRAPRRWALFAMREDHIAGLEPYLKDFPTQFTARYRLDRLTPEAARLAIVGPAQAAGVGFEPAAADDLVRDLRLVRVQQDDGTFVTREGPYIEPVHLQVVCRGLEEMTRADPARIAAADLAKLGGGDGAGAAGGGVDAVLGRYYADRVKDAARDGKVSERRVRDWFDKELITAADARKPVQRGEEAKFGILPDCLKVLDKAYLVRSESRGGAQWYELAHDRLIGPIRRDNAGWRRDNLTDIQKKAEQWRDTGEPDELLLRDAELVAGQAWAADRPWALSESEAKFLKQSADKHAQRTVEANAAAKYRRKLLLVVGGCAVVVGLGVLGTAIYLADARARSKAAEKAKGIETEKETAIVKERNDAARELERTKTLTAETQTRLRDKILTLKTNPPPDGREALRQAIAALDYAKGHNLDTTLAEIEVRAASQAVAWREIPTQGGPARVAAYHPNGKWFAIGSDDGRVRLWPTDDSEFPKGEPRLIHPPDGGGRGAGGGTGGGGGKGGGGPGSGTGPRTVTALAFHPTLGQLVSGGEDGRVWVWSTDGASLASFPHDSAVRRITFSGNGQYLITALGDGQLTLMTWPAGGVFAAQPRPPAVLVLPDQRAITSHTFTPFPKKVYAGASDGTVWNWDTAKPTLLNPVDLVKTKLAVSAVTIDPDATLLAVGTVGAEVVVFGMLPHSKDLAPGVARPIGRFGVQALAFSPDSRFEIEDRRTGWLGALTPDGRVKLWQTRDFAAVPLRGGDMVRATGFTFSPEKGRSRWLLAGGIDGAARLWDLTSTQTTPSRLSGHASAVVAVGFSPTGRWAVTTALDGRTRFWDMAEYAGGPQAEPTTFSVSPASGGVAAISADGRLAAFASGDKVRVGASESGLREWAAAPAGQHVRTVGFQARDGQVVTCGSDGRVTRWDITKPEPAALGERKVAFGTADGAGTSFAMNDGALVADQTAWFLDPSGEPRLLAAEGPNRPATKLVPAAGGRFFVSVEPRAVSVWRADPDKATLTRDRVQATTQDAVVADVSRDGKLLAVGFADGSVGLYRDTGASTLVGKVHGDAVSALRFSANATGLATGGGDGSVRLWDVGGELELSKSRGLSGHDRRIRSLQFSADGSALLSVSDDGTAKVWSVTVARLLERAGRLSKKP